MIRGAIFDLDGTLLDSMPCWDQAGETYLARRGIRARPGLAAALSPMTLPEAAVYLKGEYALPDVPREIEDGINAVVEDFYRSEAPLKAGVTALLKLLEQSGLPMAVTTVTDRYLAEAALSRLNALGYFRVILTAAEVGTGKRDPEIYLRAAAQLGTPPGQTLVFEDALHALETAKHAGFLTVGVYDASALAAQDRIRQISDFYLEDYSDLSALRAALN